MQERGFAARELLDGPAAPAPWPWGRGTPRCALGHWGWAAPAVPEPPCPGLLGGQMPGATV